MGFGKNCRTGGKNEQLEPTVSVDSCMHIHTCICTYIVGEHLANISASNVISCEFDCELTDIAFRPKLTVANEKPSNRLIDAIISEQQILAFYN